MHNDIQYDPIQGQGHERFTVGNLKFNSARVLLIDFTARQRLWSLTLL